MKKRGRKDINVFIVTILIILGFVNYGCRRAPVKEVNNQDTIKTVTKEYIKNTENLIVIDTRSDEEFNGWSLNKGIKGGHIPGAINLSAKLLEGLNDNEMKKIFKKNGLSPEKNIVVYSNYGKESLKLYNILKKSGYKNVANYEGGMQDWSKDNSLEVEKLKNYEKLVYPQWVKDLTEGKEVKNYDGREYIIVDVNYKQKKEYKKGHIKGAIYIDTNDIESLPLWNVVSDDKIKKLLNETGITKNKMIVIYSDEAMAAGRLAHVLMYAGVEDVRIINSNIKGLIDAGLSLEQGENIWVSDSDFGGQIPMQPEYTKNLKEAKELIEDPNGRLVAVVSWEEYAGINNGGYSYFTEKGRIPGSVFGYGGSDGYHSEDFVDSDGTMRDYTQIKKMWKEWDIKAENVSAFFCATGWRGALAFFDAYLMGWENVSVYDGGFYEWIQDPTNPIATGDPRVN
ncbi:rhodanese-like domain-containing protein [Fusobacteria bacterium ZRK30]|nr:rhodanese-like domain-containing protein [Fusobacteria bacterium ZRK30]